MKKFKKYTFRLAILGLLAIASALFLKLYVDHRAEPFIYANAKTAPTKHTALVLGCLVYKSGSLSGMLEDRVSTALDLYKLGKVNKFLLSGDHGRVDYDEVNAMKTFLVEEGVPESDIFTDHAGFDTYSSIVRAKEVFQAEELLIVTQEFHLPRALYIAQQKGLDAHGVVANKRIYGGKRRAAIRELFANCKALAEVSANKSPKYLGPVIPITGDGRTSYD